MRRISSYPIMDFEALDQNLRHYSPESRMTVDEFGWNPESPNPLDWCPDFQREMTRSGLDPQGWRVPTAREMRVLVELWRLGVGGYDPLDGMGYYWTSTIDPSEPEWPFWVHVVRVSKSDPTLRVIQGSRAVAQLMHVRPVRTRPNP